jgi:hypothetical protein
MSEKLLVNESELKELLELYRNIEEKKKRKKRRKKRKAKRKSKRSIPSKSRKNPSQYSAPQGSKRDKGLDRAAELYARGDAAAAARVRGSMERSAREEPGFRNKPRKDTGRYTEEKMISESILNNAYLSKEYKVENAENLLNDKIEEIKLERVLGEYEDFLDEKKKRKKRKKKRKKASGGLSAAVKKSLNKKADKRCLTRGSVYAEFRKGLAAWLSSGSRKGMGQHQWAHARVNSANPSKSWAVVKKRKTCPKKKKKK